MVTELIRNSGESAGYLLRPFPHQPTSRGWLYRSYRRISPLAPTAQPFFFVINSANRFCLVLLSCSIQVRPPSLDRKIAPPRPTIQPSSSLTNCTPSKVERAGEKILVHVRPPSSVRKIVPRSPTAQPLLSLRKLT